MVNSSKRWEVSFLEKVGDKFIEHLIRLEADSFDEALEVARGYDKRFVAAVVITE